MKKNQSGNLIGQIFGRLTVIDEVVVPGKHGNQKHMKCMCSCGNPIPILVYPRAHLTRGNTRSCGCLKADLAAERMRKMGEAARQFEPRESTARVVYFGKYNDTKKGDTLTFEQFYALSQQDCFYCAKTPSNVRTSIFSYSSEYHKNNCEFTYNGLDRIDNNLPHTQENCITCCKECNLSKRNMPLDQFYTMVSNIHTRRNIPIPNYQELFTKNTKDLSQFKRVKGQLMARYGDINFDIDLFYFILTMECFYCGAVGLSTNRCKNGDIIRRNGLDRLDQNLEHTLDNVVACCKYCNWSKAGRSSTEFRNWAERVYTNRNLANRTTLSNS